MKRASGVFAIVFAVVVGICTTLSFAQQKQSAPDRERVERERAKEGQPAPEGEFRFEFEREMQDPEGAPPGVPGDFVFFATEMNFAGKVVKGAPYSAQAITESTQTLSDGNRIVNKSTAAIYRDSEGRTRREQSLRAIGSLANGSEGPQTIFINDPVAGTSYTLDPRTHVARKMPRMLFKFDRKVPAPAGEKPGSGAGMGVGVMREPPSIGRVGPGRIEIERAQVPEMAGPDTQFIWGSGNHEAKAEALGKQNIEGVEAEGTRSTVTIPAGEIGNDRVIEIVNERWYSPELQTVVMTRHSDPRFGESSYRLTNIDRSEPARSLFEVPGDYTLKLKSGGPMPGDNIGGNDTITSGRPTVVARGSVVNGSAITLPMPPYPPIARAAHASGDVTVEVTIDEDGNVIAARAVSGHPLLQAASVAAARNAKFTPTKQSGQAVKVQGVLVYTFKSE